MNNLRISSDIDEFHPLVIKLIAAADSGDAAKVKNLLQFHILPEVRAKTASLVLGVVDPLENRILSSDCLWDWHYNSHKKKKSRPGKRTLHHVWQRIGRSFGLLIDAGADPDTLDQFGGSVLCKIARHRKLLNILQRLLDAEANPNSHDGTSATALFVAVMWNNPAAVQLLLEHGGDPNIPFESCTPLMFAAANQQLDTLRTLINAGASLDTPDKAGRTALMHALYQHGEKPYLFIYRWAREAEARRCSKEASKNITQLLIEAGADYRISDNMGFTPDDYGVAAHLQGVELPAELKVNQTYFKFCEAAMNRDSRQLTAICKSEEIPTRISSIALPLVAVRGFADCCKILLENGADPNMVNHCGISPAKAAATGLQLPILQLLVESGLSKSELSGALIDLCMASSHHYEGDVNVFIRKKLELSRYLLEHGADPNMKDDDCGDLLTIATLFEKNTALTCLLREFGAVLQSMCSNPGKTFYVG